MYRQSLNLQNTKMVEDQFFTRLGSLPVVNSAWTNAFSIYQRTKEWNCLMRMTLNLAETSILTMAETAKPIVNKCQPQIDRVNVLACKQLASLEEKYPAITHSTDQLVQESKDVYDAMLKPVTDRVSAARQFSTNAYTGVLNTGLEKANQVKKLGTDALSGVMVYGDVLFTRTLNTSYGQYVTQGVEGLLSVSELYVDKYLPSDPDDKEMDKPSVKNPIIRACNLSTKVRRRMYKRAVKELQAVQARSLDTFTKLNYTVDVMDYAKTNLDFMKDRVNGTVTFAQDRIKGTWDKLVSEEIDAKSESLEDRTILLARRLAHQVQCNVATMTTFVINQPNHLMERMRDAEKYAEDVYHVFMKNKKFEDIPSWLLEQTRERLAYVQEALSLATEYLLSTPLNWLAIDMQIDNIFLDEPEIVNCNGDAHIIKE